MGNAPRIWLDYRPVCIGWVADEAAVAQLRTAASWNTCLWGGRFNPIIPLHDHVLSEKLIQAFGVDVLIPVGPSERAKTFVASYPHLHLNLYGGIFRAGHCDFVDVRHAARRAIGELWAQGGRAPPPLVRPTWSDADDLSALFGVLFGRYPSPGEIMLDYAGGIGESLPVRNTSIEQSGEIPPGLLRSISPLAFTGWGMSWRRDRSGWLAPAIVLGDAASFDDLLLLWNLRAAGAEVCFHDQGRVPRLGAFAGAFLAAIRERPADDRKRVNIWGRAVGPPWDLSSIGLDFSGTVPTVCRSSDANVWNDRNLNPIRPRFSSWHRDVIASYTEADGAASASFALPDRPFDDQDPSALNQLFVVTVDANGHGSASDDLTFATPYLPRLNEFYGWNFTVEYDKARSEPGTFGRGAVGLVTAVGTQQQEARAYRPVDWLRSFFGLFGVAVERSEPGLRAARLIRQLGGAERVLKVRGARDLIRAYGPDQNFTRSEAEKCIGRFDEATQQMREDFNRLYIEGKKLTPGAVLQHMTARGVFRVGLEFKCPACELRGWVHLDEARTSSTCAYCGQQFDVTSQLRDRDWRFRRSGLFGRDDDQLGGIPTALAMQQLEATRRDDLLISSTALNFAPAGSTNIEKCEADFVAVVAGASGIGESPVQILLGEAKGHMPFDAGEVRKLGKLADTIPPDLAEAFIMFAKTDQFTPDEVALAKTLNSQHRPRVILWSQNELEPYHVYERSEQRLPERLKHARTLADMASITELLYFEGEGTVPK